MSKKSESKTKALSKKAQEKQKNILEMLKNHGAKIYDELDNGQFPKFSIPSRSVSNIVSGGLNAPSLLAGLEIHAL
jgi:DNA topoisomerase-6 subunit A